MIFREGNIDDLQQCKEVGLLSYSEYAEVLDNENWNKLNQILNNNNAIKTLIDKSTLFLCEIDKEVAGVIYFFSSGNPTDLYPSDVCYIRSLGVIPKYRGLGIGKKLTDMCIEHAKISDEKTIALHTSEFMDIARNMYEKMGFKKQKEVQRLGKKYWIFTKELD